MDAPRPADQNPLATPALSAEHFGDQLFDLPEGGRWTELNVGRLIQFEPPDTAHGDVVRNLSRILAAHVQQHQDGYACFELGLIVSRGPDSVQRPAISYFRGGPLFAEQDNLVTETRPALAVEIASSNDRRRAMVERVRRLLDWGVPMVWAVDTHGRQVHVFQSMHRTQEFAGRQKISGGTVVPGLEIPAEDVFAEPAWWAHQPRARES